MIRRLDASDSVAWAQIRFEALTTCPYVFGTPAPEAPETLVPLAAEELAAMDDSAVLGAFAGDELIGVVGILREPGFKERHKAWLWEMYVRSGFRGKGVGAQLLTAAIERAREWHGVSAIYLAVTERGPEARRLYERHGFSVWGTEPMALCVNGICVESAHMILELAHHT